MSITTAPTSSSAVTARAVLDAAFPDGLGAFLDGRTVPGGGEGITLTAAATGEAFATYADPGAEGANAILESSIAGAETWGGLNGFERAAILRNVSRMVEAHAEELAILEAATTGKPIRDTRAEALKVAEMFGYYAGWADKLTG